MNEILYNYTYITVDTTSILILSRLLSRPSKVGARLMCIVAFVSCAMGGAAISAYGRGLQ